ncbi:hypothetical protein OOK58_00650 [Streptomyces sp. NBC_01728]|uniref:hypothetical protein n=1 Tax=unclassified Streptomyces TaxID=2593676 RepID=UPI002253D9C7|nr:MULTISPECIES: hypothetical protein [unclassified Streptomyces]MCX4461230.1 hypothetical protein [Streptomyces sp. NBC_01719]MCX4490138.1 hypothetical protein [Streptomyces sp. NBC_01728]MCX4596887.1 hypothetical protein [Streptomyces sp. NBC_01549]
MLDEFNAAVRCPDAHGGLACVPLFLDALAEDEARPDSTRCIVDDNALLDSPSTRASWRIAAHNSTFERGTWATQGYLMHSVSSHRKALSGVKSHRHPIPPRSAGIRSRISTERDRLILAGQAWFRSE